MCIYLLIYWFLLCVFAFICIQIIQLPHRKINNNKNNDIYTQLWRNFTNTIHHITHSQLKNHIRCDTLKDSAPTIIGLVIILQWLRRCLAPVAVMWIRTRTRIRIKRYENLHVKSMLVTSQLKPLSVCTAKHRLEPIYLVTQSEFFVSFRWWGVWRRVSRSAEGAAQFCARHWRGH